MNHIAEKKLLQMHERGYVQTGVVMTGTGGTAIVSEMGRVTWLDETEASKITGPAREPDDLDEPIDRYKLSSQDLRTAIEATISTCRNTGPKSSVYQILENHLAVLLLAEKARAQGTRR